MTRKIPFAKRAVAVVAVSVVASITGCTVGAEAPAQNEGPATISLANTQWLDPTRGDALWGAVAAYAEDSDNELERVDYPGTEISMRLTTELAAGSGPDVMFIQDGLFESFLDAGFLAPLDEAVADADLNDTSDGAISDGVRYGVTWQRAPFGLVYNKALLAEAGVEVPTTVDELIDASKRIAEVTGVTGFGDQTPLAGDPRWGAFLNIWSYGQGGSWADSSGALTIDSAKNVAGFETVKKIVDSGIYSTEPLPTNRALFAQGQVAMMSDLDAGALAASSEGVVDPQDVGVAPHPVPGPGFHQQLYVVVNAKSANLDAALDFVRWLMTPAAQQGLREASGPAPLATDVPIPTEYADQYPWAEGFLEIGTKSKSGLIPGYELQTAEIMNIILIHLEQATANNVDSKQALKDASAEIEALVG